MSLAQEGSPAEVAAIEQPTESLPTTTDPTARDTFQLPVGFKIEQLFEVPKETHGSWVSLAFDPQGRLIVSDQGDKGLYRVTLPAIDTDQPTRVEKLDVEISSAQGMLYAFGSLYVSINDGDRSGFYRLRDTNDDGQYDDVKRLKVFRGQGEHGPHSIRLSADGKSLMVVCGNHTLPPEGFQVSRMLSNWQEDLLLPRQWDARGHARGILAPGGWIARTDPDGQAWEMISIGYRNTFDFALGPEDEIFAYDADMEWDFGMPWYRPTRLVHAVSGSEFGWRSGTGKWPAYFADSLPPVVNIGPGSPTGVVFGSGLKFPTKYQRAMYLLDWTFGTMYAIHLTPDGASYTGEKEEFVARGGLPLTDAAVGPDGALYFAVGGRNTQSALYRVTYVGDDSIAPPEQDARLTELRQLRRKLEAFHPTLELPAPKIDAALILLSLGHSDRHVRFAARTALEHQPIETWVDQLQAASSPVRTIQLAIAVARAGSSQLNIQSGDAATASHSHTTASVKIAALNALASLDVAELSVADARDLLRAYGLVFIRLGAPTTQEAAEIAAKLEGSYPAADSSLNHEFARLLVYLNAPTVVQKTLALMELPYSPPAKDSAATLLERNPGYGNTIAKMLSNHPELDKLHYAFMLRNARYGWTLEERRRYFDWLEEAKQRSGGMSYVGFLDNVRKDALANVPEAQQKRLSANADFEAQPIPTDDLPKPVGPGQSWTQEKIVQSATSGLSGRDFENGKRMFAAARCVVCHRFDGAGGATGPDLTSVAGRFSLKDLTDAVLKPSNVISDQYRASLVETSDGLVLTGRIVGETDEELTVQTNPEDPTKIATIPKAKIETLQPSPVSLMPEQLLNTLNEQEVLDLIAYLLSRGNPADLMFQAGTSLK